MVSRRARQSEQALAGPIVDATEDDIFRSHLSWILDMPSRFMVVRVGQFLTGHFLTGPPHLTWNGTISPRKTALLNKLLMKVLLNVTLALTVQKKMSSSV